MSLIKDYNLIEVNMIKDIDIIDIKKRLQYISKESKYLLTIISQLNASQYDVIYRRLTNICNDLDTIYIHNIIRGK